MNVISCEYFFTKQFWGNGSIFWKKKEKSSFFFGEGEGLFLRERKRQYDIFEYKLFCHKFYAEYFLNGQFFRKEQYFSRKLRKIVVGGLTIFFKRWGRLMPKINLFCHKLAVENFFITPFFGKTPYFPSKPRKTVLGVNDRFWGEEGVLIKNKYNLSCRKTKEK